MNSLAEIKKAICNEITQLKTDDNFYSYNNELIILEAIKALTGWNVLEDEEHTHMVFNPVSMTQIVIWQETLRRLTFTYDDVIKAIADGKKVHWATRGYSIIKDKKGQYLIQYISGHCIGLPDPSMEEYYTKTFENIYVAF